MDWYKQSSEEVMQNLKSSKNGLSDTEVKKRFLKFMIKRVMIEMAVTN